MNGSDAQPTQPAPDAPFRKSGMAALVGRASVGKSSLTNALLGEKLSIVSKVPQTTRSLIRGIVTEARGQLVLVDTPGMHRAVAELGRVMNRMARSAIEGTDGAVLVLDATTPPREEDEGWMRRLAKQELPVIIVINKADLGTPCEPAYREAWATASAGAENPPVPQWFKVSAQTGDGVPALLDALFALLPEGPPLFPEDILSDYPRKLNVADIIREKLFGELRDELPHDVAVWVEELDDTTEPWTARVIIYVNRHSQKGIVIGERGRALRKVRRSSEGELESVYEHKVSLDLWVKVEPNWSRNFWLLKKFGYVA